MPKIAAALCPPASVKDTVVATYRNGSTDDGSRCCFKGFAERNVVEFFGVV